MNRQGFLATLLFCLFAVTAHAAWYSVAPLELGNVIVSRDAISFKAKVTNFGSQTVTNITYTLYDVDNQRNLTTETLTFGEPLPTGDTRTIDINLNGANTYGKHQLYLNITAVNGQPNEATKTYAYVDLYTVSRVPKKRIVVEDYTGMWCGYCPRGTVTMAYLERLFPDKFIGVAIHCRNYSRDYLDTGAYSDILGAWALGYPSVWVSRKQKVGDWVEGKSYFDNADSEPAALDVEVSAVWQDNHTGIDVTTSVTPCLDADSGRYAIAYVLTENGMQNSSWAQANFYSGEYYANAPYELDLFTKGGNYVYGLTYDHVAIAAKGIDKGVENSLPSRLMADVTQKHTISFDNLLQYSIIQNYDSLSIVAMVIDRQTNQVENAAQCRVVNSTTTGVNNLNAVAKTVDKRRYNLNGMRAGKGYKGLVIEGGKKRLTK